MLVDRVDLSVATGARGLSANTAAAKRDPLAIMGLLSKQAAEVTGSIRFGRLRSA